MSKTRRKRCSECGELKDDVDGRQRLCERCEEGKTYCQICDEHMNTSWGDGCRHLRWVDGLGNAGCGSTGINAEEHHESFLALLRHLEPLKTYDDKPLLPAMQALIAENRFWTQWQGSLIGGPPDLALRYSVKNSDWCPDLYTIRSATQLAWGEKAIDAMQVGMAWMTSLDERSKAANKLTAGWIDDFMAKRQRGAA